MIIINTPDADHGRKLENTSGTSRPPPPRHGVVVRRAAVPMGRPKSERRIKHRGSRPERTNGEGARHPATSGT